MRMRRSSRNRTVSFAVVGDVLEQGVCFPDDHAYTHRCPRKSYEAVAHAVEEGGRSGFTLEEIAGKEDLPTSQVNCAMAYLLERGCIEKRGRQNYAAHGYGYEDAMIEYCALAYQHEERIDGSP